jgi:hypothetical protein
MSTYLVHVTIPSFLIAVAFVVICIVLFAGALSAWFKATGE